MEMAQLVKNRVRPDDVLGRYGGEEFVLLLPAIGPKAAQKILDRIRTGVEALEHPLENGELLKVTLSAGIASYPLGPRRYDTPDALMQAADEALYRAKQKGRNRVVSAA